MPFKKANVVVQGLAYVPPEEGDHPMPPIYIPIEPPDPPLEIWGDILLPTHPIYIPLPPLEIWGPTDPRPTPPIALPPPGEGGGGQPPGIWGGGNEPFPTPPIYIPIRPPDLGAGAPHPEHPIYWPVEIWGPTDPRPTPPINLPPWTGGGGPDEPPDIDDDLKQKLIDFLFGHLPDYVAPH